ncbi:mRNA splicing protein (Prp39) [Moelleriella libera RCEF 2490]|uniref:mRNA splicing protein (Prp39) n=1 Tax=Moelleriella libera RCEF 2490 TaxID=1081109 RepID=A0A168B3M9_9HYPO|nr:mRNA splicing protein (Prp39) [Moelleriella libera RCEF 2490]
MSEFAGFGGSDEEYATVRKYQEEVEADPDSFDSWENYVKATETLDGGLNRNSSPQALATFRQAYDALLHKFPLLFGYWKKYADTEFNIAGPESAEMVYERGCANITNSVDLWTDYCSFKMETTHDPQIVRDLFERGASLVGLDFLAHPFWDKYIEYEERQEAQDRIYAIHARVIRIPLHQYARYYEKFRTLTHTQPLGEVVAADVLARFRSEVDAEAAAQGAGSRPESEVERDIRAKVDAMYYEVFMSTQQEVSKRWTYESEIKRPYFHVTALEHSQLNNWRKYLDFEESEGDFDRATSLYERCLVTCAFYDEFWFRFARWMAAHNGKDEEVRNIYIRASIFVPISRPGIRMQWAYFEESSGRVDVALDIHSSILMKLPDCVEVIVSWAHVQRRQNGLEAAIQVYRDHIDAPTVDLYTKAALVAEWAQLLWRVKRSADEARAVFLKNSQWYGDSLMFWEKWLAFELDQGATGEEEQETAERIKNVFDEFRTKSRLSMLVKRELAQEYMNYLVQRGGKEAMKIFLEVDREMFGPASSSSSAKSTSAIKENGAAGGELDEVSRRKAELRLLTFYEAHVESVFSAQEPADFN